MAEPITKLVAVEFTVDEDSGSLPMGTKYTILQDPKTGLFYEPVPGWYVTGEDLTELFNPYSEPRESPPQATN